MTTTPTPDIIMECLDALGNKVVFIQNDVYIKSERAKEQLATLRAENERLAKRVDYFERAESLLNKQLLEENTTLEEALAFYAEPDQYVNKVKQGIVACHILIDNGNKARTALEKGA